MPLIHSMWRRAAADQRARVRCWMMHEEQRAEFDRHEPREAGEVRERKALRVGDRRRRREHHADDRQHHAPETSFFAIAGSRTFVSSARALPWDFMEFRSPSRCCARCGLGHVVDGACWLCCSTRNPRDDRPPVLDRICFR